MPKERAPIDGKPVRSHSLTALLADLEPDMTSNKMPNPYNVEINGQPADVYTILLAYGVTCPATGHAIKKLLCAGRRGGGKNRLQDLAEAQVALARAIDLEVGE